MYGTIVGTIGKDSKLKVLDSGAQILEFSIVENAWVGSEKSTWYTCSMFGKRGAQLEAKLVKGCKVSVIGQSYMDEFTNHDNDTVKSLRCKVTDVVIQKFAGSESSSGGYNGNSVPNSSAPPSAPTERKERFEDDIPF